MCEVVLDKVTDSITFANLRTDVKEPTTKLVSDLVDKACMAQRVRWRSWLWQVRALGKKSASYRPGIRLVCVDAPDTLCRIASREAWWGLSKPCLMDVCKDMGVEVERSADLFSVLWNLVKHCLKLSDSHTLAILHRRVAASHDAEAVSGILDQLDEGVEVMDRADHRQFGDAYKSKAGALHGGEGAKNNGGMPVARDKTNIPHHCDQKAANKLLPPRLLYLEGQRKEWLVRALPAESSHVGALRQTHGLFGERLASIVGSPLDTEVRRAWRRPFACLHSGRPLWIVVVPYLVGVC